MLPPHSGPEGTDRVMRKIVVVGGGPAAAAAVEEARALGFAGSLTVLCGEPEGRYDRTACSKGLIEGSQRPRDVMLPVTAGAAWRIGERAVSVDPRRRVVTGASGLKYPYDGLVIASGGRTAVPDSWPVGEQGIYPVRTIADALKLRRALRGAGKVAIVGGGLTGCEIASRVVRDVRELVIIDPNPTLLNQVVGDQIGTMVTSEHRDAGVELRLGRSVIEVRRNRRGRFQLCLDDDTTVIADLVVLALGEVPDTSWLAGCGLDLTDGVLCDSALRVIGAEGIVAAGTVARWPNPRYDAPPARCDHWTSAMEQGCAAARTLLARDGHATPVTVIPRYSSEQYRLRIQVVGMPVLGSEVRLSRVRRGAVHRPVGAGVLATYHRDDRLVAAAAVNAPVAFAEVLRAHQKDLLALPARPTPAARQRVPEEFAYVLA